jgi:hypothetical protein
MSEIYKSTISKESSDFNQKIHVAMQVFTAATHLVPKKLILGKKYKKTLNNMTKDFEKDGVPIYDLPKSYLGMKIEFSNKNVIEAR